MGRLIDGILKGDILGAFDRFYADDVGMSENGVDQRVGKAACRAYEEAFVGGVVPAVCATTVNAVPIVENGEIKDEAARPGHVLKPG